MKSSNVEVKNPVLDQFGIRLFLKREDQIHKTISGNKYRKLKYNVLEAKKIGSSSLLSFGGAYSNHIEAVSYAGKLYGFNTIGLIRGEELANNTLNETLKRATQNGMKLHFISRKEYQLKNTQYFLDQLKNKYPKSFIIPEGGTNALAVKGCEEILNENDSFFDFVCCSVGTGGTISGLIRTIKSNQQVLGFSSLKGDFLDAIVSDLIQDKHRVWKINYDYCFGGYAKVSSELITFINNFKATTNILLDPIYTGKMLFGIIDLVKKGKFKKNTSILAIHTGGLQGIDGMNTTLEKKGLPIIIK